jgi:hypothetical protein
VVNGVGERSSRIRVMSSHVKETRNHVREMSSDVGEKDKTIGLLSGCIDFSPLKKTSDTKKTGRPYRSIFGY